MNDINRNAEDDNFLDISNYHYSDDDVELLGVTGISFYKYQEHFNISWFQSDSGDFFLNVGAPNPSVIATRTQVYA